MIFEGVIWFWLDVGKKFILKEDGDFGYGIGRRSNIVKAWKKEYGLKYYVNIPNSRDLLLIKNCW